MVNKLGFFSKLGCWLIGWNPRILAECGEASFRALRRYVAALTILMIIWSTIGYCFAERYIGIDSTFGKIGVALVFMIVILCIERFIILHVGKLGFTGIVRIVLAMLMAILGSTIFDQIIFKNDVDIKMKEIRTEQINAEIPKRLAVFDADIQKLTLLIDSIGKDNISIYEKLAKNPVIVATDVSTTTKVVGKDEDGKPIEEKVTNINKRSVENPLAAQAKANENALEKYQAQQKDYTEKKINVEKDVRKEYEEAHVGFLEELRALFSILFSDWIAMAFYLFLFAFLMLLELLVVSTKSGSGNCDYDMIVEHQLNIKRKTLSDTENKLLGKVG